MRYFGWIIIFFIIVYIIPLGSRPMLAPDEFIQAETAREMLVDGNYTVATLFGQDAADQMPMKYWLTAGSFKLFGINSFAARLPSALAVGLTALLIAWFIHQSTRDEKLAALSSMIYMLFSITMLLGGAAQPQAIFTLFAAGSLGTLFLAAQEERFNRRKSLLLILSGISAGAAFLTCGAIGVILPAVIFFLYLLFTCRYKELLLLPLPWLICAAAAAAPWIFCLADLRSECWQELFSWHNFVNSIGSSGQWYKSFIWFAIGLFPAAILLPAALMAGKEAWGRLLKNNICRFALLAIAVPPIYLAALRNCDNGIVLIAFPAAAIMLAMGLQAYFNSGGHHRSFDWMLNIWALLLLATGIIESAVWFMRNSILTEFFNCLPISRLFMINLGVTSIIGGGILIYSLRGNWRSRLYLFFFSAAILPLGISWCFTSNSRIPEAAFNTLINEMDILTDKSVFVTSDELAPALAWCTENRQIIILTENKPLCRTFKTPVYTILKSNDPAWSTLPKPEKAAVFGEFTCAKINLPCPADQQ